MNHGVSCARAGVGKLLVMRAEDSQFQPHPLLPGLGGAYPLTAAVAGGPDQVGQARSAHTCWGPKIQGLSIILPH